MKQRMYVPYTRVVGLMLGQNVAPGFQNVLTVLPVLPLSVCDHSSLKHSAGPHFVISALGCCPKVAPQNTSSKREWPPFKTGFLGKTVWKTLG